MNSDQSKRREPFYFLLTIVTLATTYGVILPMSISSDLAGAILCWVFSVSVGIWIGFRLWNMLSHESTTKTICYFVDTLIGIYHALALLAYSMWLMDTSVLRDSFFVNIDPSAGRYGVFVSDFGFATVSVFNGAGYGGITPTSASVLSGIWSIVVSISGVFMLAFTFALILKRVQLPVVRPRYMSLRVIKR